MIKAIDDQQIETDLISGASILGDGRVVLILNLTALVERFTSQRTAPATNRVSGLLSGIGKVSGNAAHVRGMAGGQA